jgi:uncharacterized protein YcbK (DUF882 family)
MATLAQTRFAEARRHLLQAGAAAAFSALTPSGLAQWLEPAVSAQSPRQPSAAALAPRSLWVTRPQAQESARITFWAEGQLQPEGCARLDHLFRDLYAGLVLPMAPGLWHLNHLLQRRVHAYWGPRPMVLLSGYRCAATNRRVGGVEPNWHGRGVADDFTYEGPGLLQLARLLLRLPVGGLGVYPERGSLHKDTGPRRTWVTRGRAAPGA